MSIKDEVKDEFLKAILLKGSIDSGANPIIASENQRSNILNLSSGLPKISSRATSRFKLILSQPLTLQALNPFEIRCCLCRSVISYPCWYHSVKYAVNEFHYFICFDSNSADKPTARCYKR